MLLMSSMANSHHIAYSCFWLPQLLMMTMLLRLLLFCAHPNDLCACQGCTHCPNRQCKVHFALFLAFLWLCLSCLQPCCGKAMCLEQPGPAFSLAHLRCIYIYIYIYIYASLYGMAWCCCLLYCTTMMKQSSKAHVISSTSCISCMRMTSRTRIIYRTSNFIK